MLFNSYIFLFIFLPTVYLGALAVIKVNPSMLVTWMGAASIGFYLWWSVNDTVILFVSILINYAIGNYILLERNLTTRRRLLAGGIVLNLCALSYYKYANFFFQNLNIVMQADTAMMSVALPLGISFFTFTQIAFLVDCNRNNVSQNSFSNYLLFVTYFPHLIAGPIIHHKEMLSQFSSMHEKIGRLDLLSVGLTVFIIGLFKKVVLADSIAPYADVVFDSASYRSLSFLEAWSGSVAYTLQIYFDFSPYTDMAIGISYMFGVRLPLNFDSPYKSRSIIEFWRRWHITLSRFLRDHIYIPMGGSRRSGTRRLFNLVTTMLIGGLWHGANWTFVIWGALHGGYLVVNHGFRAITKGTKIHYLLQTKIGVFFSTAFTFTCVVFAWAIFRASDLESAYSVIRGMLGMNGFQLPDRYMPFLGSFPSVLNFIGVEFITMDAFGSKQQIGWTFLLLLIALFGPNVREIMRNHSPYIESNLVSKKEETLRFKYIWNPTAQAATIVGILCITVLWLMLNGDEIEFIYFNF
jgi:alginate O-acetyltransferase complex protein AlgI